MRRLPTLQDIADRAGVHRTTVSMALRNHPRIPAATRERILALAKKLHYRVNPLVAALMKARRTGRAAKHAVLAYITNHSTRFGWRDPALDLPDFFPGAARRAKDFGFILEHFWMAEPGMTAERFCDILLARGIHGILLGRLPVHSHELTLAWEKFSCVALGLTLEFPRLHHVAENHFFTTSYSMEQCLRRGYRRIGFAFTTSQAYPRVVERWLGGFYSQQRHLAPADHIPVYDRQPLERADFLAWFERWRPDAVLVSSAAEVIPWLHAAGYAVPGDVAVVELLDRHPRLGHSGVFYDPAKVGALGIEMLVGLIHRNERGVPKDPHEVLLPGHWVEGRTIAKQR